MIPDTSYTAAWSSGRGEVKFFVRSDGSRLRYFTAGTGPSLVLLHTVRTQLDYFQRVIPQLWDSFTIYALDLPGMGWSDIVAGAGYDEPDLRAAVIEFVMGLDQREVTLAGESLGAALALSASVELKDRVSRVVAFNPYDYPGGFERGNWFARLIGTSIRLPGSGPVFAAMESRPILKGVLRGGFVDASKLSKDFLLELRRSGSRAGYPKVARAIMRTSTDLSRPDLDTRMWRCRSRWSTASRTGRVRRSAITSQACWPTSTGSPSPTPDTSRPSSVQPKWCASCCNEPEQYQMLTMVTSARILRV